MNRDVKTNITPLIVETKDHRIFRPEAIFIDLDGTLFDKVSKNASKKNIRAIKEIQKSIPVIISTGRSFSIKVKHFMKKLGVQYCICQNGALVYDKNEKQLFNVTLNKEQIDGVIKIVREHNIGFTVNSQFLIYTDNKL